MGKGQGDTFFSASSAVVALRVIVIGIAVALAVGFLAGELLLGRHELFQVAPYHFDVRSPNMCSL